MSSRYVNSQVKIKESAVRGCEMVLVVMNNGDLYHISESVWQQACQAKQEWLNFKDTKTGRRVSIQLRNVSVVRYES